MTHFILVLHKFLAGYKRFLKIKTWQQEIFKAKLELITRHSISICLTIMLVLWKIFFMQFWARTKNYFERKEPVWLSKDLGRRKKTQSYTLRAKHDNAKQEDFPRLLTRG